MPLSDKPQSNTQHPVPQNIMDVEFKLIGDLTMRQFSYLFIFGLISYLSFATVPGIFKWPLVFITAMLALGLAFVPVQERGLDEWLVNFFRSINSPTQRIWRKEPQLPTAFLYDSLNVVRHEMITLAPTSSRRKLEEYLKYKTEIEDDDPLDIPEKSYAMKVRQAYPQAYKPAGVGVGLALEEPISEDIDYIEEQQSISEKPSEFEEGGEQVSASKTPSSEENIYKKRIEERQAPTEAPAVIKRSRISHAGGSQSSGFVLPGRFSDEGGGFSYGSITPDMHSGRKFVNLVPSEGRIVLPMRSQRVLKTIDDSQIRDDLDEKAKKLRDLLDKIRKEEGIAPEIKPQKSEKEIEVVDKQAQEVVEKLKKQNEELAIEMEKLRNKIDRGKSMSLETSAQEQLLRKLESQKGDIAASYSELRSQVQDLQKRLDEKIQVSTGDEFNQKVKTQLPILSNKPNVVTGVVRDKEGKFLSEILLIIKNSRGDTVRAFKTNSLGQFIVSTPLQNGAYTVEVSPSNKIDLTFGIIPIEVKGGVIPILDIIGK